RRQQRLEAENRSLKPDVRPLLIAEAPSMRPVLELISRVGPSEANVLVTGENGTGKGTVAQAIHSVSGRAGKGLVTVNARGLSEALFESELPPLRDRREDIPALATHFVRQHANRYRKNITGFEPAAMQALLDHPWPGNIRELDHAVERGVLMAQGSMIRLGELGLRIDRDAGSRMEDMSLEEVEGFLIKKATARFDGNVSQAAKALGLSRSALYRRLQRYGL